MTFTRALSRARPGSAAAWIGFLSLLALLYVIAGLSGALARHFTFATGGQILIGLGTAAFALRQSKLAGWSKAWLLLAISTLLTQVATTGFLVNSLLSRDQSAPWLLFAVYLATYPLLYAALIRTSS
ncbi:MAG: hypothetical protein A2133_00365 [Actinobacteria bacterium RBG_16_64_13]|nr:MAG: hypothetical protein A2133_00365 [Actinobacteria bacterium RBG_16_64_13]